jgi:hypothetical protein
MRRAALLALLLGCAPGNEAEQTAVARDRLSLGAPHEIATVDMGIPDIQIVSTSGGYALAYTNSNTVHVAWLDSSGASAGPPSDVYTSPGPVKIHGLAWDGSKALVITERPELSFNGFVQGHFVSPGAAPTLAFRRYLGDES